MVGMVTAVAVGASVTRGTSSRGEAQECVKT